MIEKNNKFRKVFFFIAIIITIFLILISYLVANDLKQEDILKKEIVNITNKDLLKDNYDIKVKTTGDYAYIEEAIKKYFKELSDNVKLINSYLNNEDLINILSAKNLESDGPDFEKSYKLLNDVKTKSNESMKTIINLCSEDTIKDLIDKEKVDKYSYELYLELMGTKKDLEGLNNTKNEIQTINTKLNTFLDKVTAMIDILKNNSNNWFIDEGQLYFETDNLVNQYNSLHKDLESFVEENFSEYNNNSTDNTEV